MYRIKISTKRFTIRTLNLKDINLDDDDYVNREVKIMYSEKF